MEELDRRTLLRRAGLLAGTGALAGLAGCEPDRAQRDPAPGPAAAAPSGWAGARAQFELDPAKRHFAAFVLASHPRPVAEAIERHRRGLQADADGYLEDHGQRLDRQARAAAAEYLADGGPQAADTGQVVFTRSTTDGLGLLYGGLRLRAGQEVVTTTHDFYSTHEALRLRAERTGASVRRITLYEDPAAVSGERLVAAVRRGLGPRTRVLALTWVHSGTGVRLPLAEICAAVAEHNRRPRPAGQGAGLRRRRPRPRRRAGGRARPRLRLPGRRLPQVAVRPPRHRPGLGPARRLGRGHRHRPRLQRRGHRRLDQRPRPRRQPLGLFEPGGFHTYEHRWALAEAFRFQLGLGKRAVADRTRALATRLKDGLAAIPAVRLVTPRDPDLSAGIVCLELDGGDPGETMAALRRQGILASVTPYAEPYLRLGPSIVTSEDDVDAAVAAIRALA